MSIWDLFVFVFSFFTLSSPQIFKIAMKQTATSHQVHRIMPLAQLEELLNGKHRGPQESVSSVTDGDKYARSPTSRRKWYEFLRIQICTHKGCHRILRTRSHRLPVHTLCCEHAFAVSTAVSEVVRDRDSKSSSRGLSEASTPYSDLMPLVEFPKLCRVTKTQHKSIIEGLGQRQAEQCTPQQQQQKKKSSKRTVTEKRQQNLSYPTTNDAKQTARVDLFNPL